MKQILIIPDSCDMEFSAMVAKEYGVGYEYNDFYSPEVLDDGERVRKLISDYKKTGVPLYCTMHGAFFDVLPTSADKRIREVARLRVAQSLETARKIGAGGVVFHTNYNPFLNGKEYVKNWTDENVRYWGGVLEQNSDINIYLENMFDETPELLGRLSEQLCRYENYGVCLDYAHAFLSKVVPEEWARCLGPFVKHVHINDNDGVSDLHLGWGEGVTDRERFYRCYEAYLKGASVLVETTGRERIMQSLCRFKEDGFLS